LGAETKKFDTYGKTLSLEKKDFVYPAEFFKVLEFYPLPNVSLF
jgi:hypothetical protein